MRVDYLNGPLHQRYPSVKYTPVLIDDSKPTKGSPKGSAGNFTVGDKLYVPPQFFDSLGKATSRADRYPNLTTPWIDVAGVITNKADLKRWANSKMLRISSNDLRLLYVGQMADYTSWAQLISEVYQQYISDRRLQVVHEFARLVMIDHMGASEVWDDNDYRMYYVDSALFSKYADVPQLASVEMRIIDINQINDANLAELIKTAPVKTDAYFFPADQWMIISITSGGTTLMYRGFIYSNDREFPMIDLLRLDNLIEPGAMFVDKNDNPHQLTLEKLYTAFFKSDYPAMVARYVNGEKRSPLMLCGDDPYEDSETLAEGNSWGMGYEYLDSVRSREHTSAENLLKIAKGELEAPAGPVTVETVEVEVKSPTTS